MKYKLDNEEKEILNEYKNDEYVEIPDMVKEIEKHAEYAKATFQNWYTIYINYKTSPYRDLPIVIHNPIDNIAKLLLICQVFWGMLFII